MVKRFLDLSIALTALLMMSPVLLIVMALIWLQDRHSPFYVASRVGRDGGMFRMVKLRSMRAGADKTGVDSTAADDNRITKVGHFIRRWKLDEFSQLINVVGGQMSLVGPRPNVTRDVELYTEEERRLLAVRPGITDLSSIVFSDEGDILEGSSDPDLKYNQVIRPWKSRLGLIYVDRRSSAIDLCLIFLTALAIVSKQHALKGIVRILRGWEADPQLIGVCERKGELPAFPPPGATEVVRARA